MSPRSWKPLLALWVILPLLLPVTGCATGTDVGLETGERAVLFSYRDGRLLVAQLEQRRGGLHPVDRLSVAVPSLEDVTCQPQPDPPGGSHCECDSDGSFNDFLACSALAASCNPGSIDLGGGGVSCDVGGDDGPNPFPEP